MLWLALHLPALSLESWAATLPWSSPAAVGAAGLVGPGSAEGPAGQPAASVAPTPSPGPAAAPARPLALLHDHQVQMADAAALARGVRPGMKRATALALAPDLLLGAADPQRDAQALRAVVHVALAFTPSVAWATPADWRLPPDQADQTDRQCMPPSPASSPALVGVRLEVQASLRYFGGLPRLLQRLRDQLAPLGHQVRIASAPTALGAALLAGWRADLALGRHATQPAALNTLLDAVPLHLLGAGLQHAQALQGMGLRTLADLAGLPRDGLARRFSPALLDDIDRARGQAPDAQQWLQAPPRFDSRLELMARADTSDQVLAGARLLLARLVAWAQARQGRIARFSLVMHHEPRHRHDSEAPERTTLAIAPAQPALDAAHLLGLLTERLGRLPLPAPALELSLHCDALVAASPPNAELFASRSSEQEGLARLVERLQARLGRTRVLRLQAVADHRPEQATRWQPADPARLGSTPPAERGLAPQHTRQASAVLSAQPLWLLPEARPLAATRRHDAGAAATSRNGAGAASRLAPGRSAAAATPADQPPTPGLPAGDPRPLLDGQPLQLLAGPERLETGWWDDQLALRDYFIAQTADGALVWIYRHRQPPAPDGQAGGPASAAPRWFLQGLFA